MIFRIPGFALFGLVAFAQTAGAQILLTELSTQSSLDIGSDYFELTNVGESDLDIGGWLFEDESALFGEAAPITGISNIAAGESVVVFRLDERDVADPGYDPDAEIAAFRSQWGGLEGVQVGWHAGAGLGKGDAINLFDAMGTLQLFFEYGMTKPEQTHAGDWAAGNTDGSDTFENEAAIWVPGSDPQQFVLAQAGVFGSFANSAGEFGSPGVVVPEPTAAAVLCLALAGLFAQTNRRRAN